MLICHFVENLGHRISAISSEAHEGVFCFSGCWSWCSTLMPFLFVTVFVQATHRTWSSQ